MTDLAIPGYESPVQIGRGGFATVYRARQPVFDREVAIKVLSGSLDVEARLRFERECAAIGGLSGHPNIVTVYDHGISPDGSAYIVMEFLSGGSLADRIDRGGPLPWTRVDSAKRPASSTPLNVTFRDCLPVVPACGSSMQPPTMAR